MKKKSRALARNGRVYKGTVEDYRGAMGSRMGLSTTRRLSDLEAVLRRHDAFLRRHDANFAKIDAFNQDVAQTVNKLEGNVDALQRDMSALSRWTTEASAAIRKLAKG